MAKRFVRKGITKYHYLPTVTDPATGPSRTELTAGTDLSKPIADISGWSVSNNAVSVPDADTTFDGSIPGSDSADSSSFTMYEDLDDTTIEDLLPKGTDGFVYIMRKGDKPSDPSGDLFPVRVASKSPEYSVGDDPARFVVTFTITDEPNMDTAIPAASSGT